MPEWAWVWRAWQQLDSGRAWLSGMAAAPRRISWASLLHWASVNGLTGSESDDLQHLIGEMEAEYASIEAERRAAP
ncbi:MAG: hypothetical protein JWR10_3438 [Rubritepida sp.]|nr:hypothetical protein [Rubritepida sp.]